MKIIHIFAIIFVLFLVAGATNVGAQYYNYNYNGNCTYHAYRLCQGNSVYWFDSCGNQQDLYYSCYNGQTCQYGQCVAYAQPIYNPGTVYTPPVSSYIVHYKTACYANSVYWFDSLGAATGLYKNCSDTNSCTLDSCATSKCVNTLKCDGSTCAAGSADYNKYCLTSQPATTGLTTSFFAKQTANSAQWEKSAQANAGKTIYFMISVANNSASQIDNINVSANIPAEISSLGNLMLNGTPFSGNIVTGVNIGSLSPMSADSITFEGKTQSISINSAKQAIATSSAAGATESDTVSLNFIAGQVEGASVSASPATVGFGTFLNRWWVWILVAIVLVILFIFIFRRLSSET